MSTEPILRTARFDIHKHEIFRSDEMGGLPRSVFHAWWRTGPDIPKPVCVVTVFEQVKVVEWIHVEIEHRRKRIATEVLRAIEWLFDGLRICSPLADTKEGEVFRDAYAVIKLKEREAKDWRTRAGFAKFNFEMFSAYNEVRLREFRNSKGERVHSKNDGSDWLLSQWSNAVAGETGELCNLIKKVERGDMTLDEARDDIGREIADVITYLDILATRCGVHIPTALVGKWNEVSERIGHEARL